MSKRVVSGTMLTLLLVGMLTLAFNIQPVKASGTIYIRADGSVEGTTDITSVDNFTYTFIGNINESIVVERDNIVVDGAGYTVQGTGSEYGIDLTGRSNVTIKNVEIKTCYRSIYVYGCSNISVFGNHITNSRYPIGFFESSYNTIYDNNITDNIYGIDASGSNNIISGNNIKNNERFAIGIGGYSSVISGNNIKNNDIGIILGGSFNSVVSGNNVTANNWCGIVLHDSSNNTVYGNHIANSSYGIRFVGTAYPEEVPISTVVFNNISGNILKNHEMGIYLYYSSNNTISGNDITNNEHGFFFGSRCLNNVVYHNNLMDNTEQVYWVDSRTNVWDDGYPSGGNYWSDHVCTGNPSDGSQPYIIDENNVDHYPFQDPNGWLLPQIEGDINRDGIVDISDVVIAALCFGSTVAEPNIVGNPYDPRADLNTDGLIDIVDLVIIGVNFGKTG